MGTLFTILSFCFFFLYLPPILVAAVGAYLSYRFQDNESVNIFLFECDWGCSDFNILRDIYDTEDYFKSCALSLMPAYNWVILIMRDLLLIIAGLIALITYGGHQLSEKLFSKKDVDKRY